MSNLLVLSTELMRGMIMSIFTGFAHSWPAILLATLTVSVMRAYISPEKMKQKLVLKPQVSIIGSTLFGAVTPLCAGGTLGLIVGLLTTVMPWGPIMAFLTSSPLMSVDGFILVSGVINVRFATALAVASIAIGLFSGYVSHLLETRTGFLENQTRFTAQKPDAIGICGIMESDAPCGASNAGECDGNAQVAVRTQQTAAGFLAGIKWREIGNNALNIGIKNIVLWFSVFMAIGYLINRFVPTSFVAGLLGAHNMSAIPLAALIGLPLYITTEASIPFIKALIAQGAGEGAMLAFWITGQATSIWIIVGLASFMKRRAIGLYIGFILVGGLVSGYVYNFVLSIIG